VPGPWSLVPLLYCGLRERAEVSAMNRAMEPFPITQVNQIGMVVRDLDAAMRAYWEQLRIGPWTVYTYQRPLLREMTYRGRPANYRMRLAFTMCGNVQLELIQSLEGPNVYEEFLAQGRTGLHHVGIWVPNFPEAVRELKARGYEVIQSGSG